TYYAAAQIWPIPNASRTFAQDVYYSQAFQAPRRLTINAIAFRVNVSGGKGGSMRVAIYAGGGTSGPFNPMKPGELIEDIGSVATHAGGTHESIASVVGWNPIAVEANNVI